MNCFILNIPEILCKSIEWVTMTLINYSETAILDSEL